MSDVTYTIGADNTEAKKSLQEFADQAVSVGKIFKGAFLADAAMQALKAGFTAIKNVAADTIKEASNFDNAVNSLNVALAASGKFSEEASQGFQDYAQSIQETTKYSDDAVISSAALLTQMTKLSNEGVKQATQAALDLSAAYRIDLDTATRMVGKAAEGNVTSFGKLGITIKKGNDDAETFANTLTALSRVSGAASASANTYDGSLTKLSNSFNDVLKTIGQYRTRSPAVVVFFKELSSGLQKFSEFIKSSFGNKDIFKDFITSSISFTKAILYIGTVIKTELELPFLRFSEMATKFGSLFSFGEQADVMKKHLGEIQAKIQAVKDAGDAEFENNPFIMFLTKMQEKVVTTSGSLNTLTEGVKNNGALLKEELEFQAIEFTNSVLDNFTFFGISVGLVTETTIQEMERMKQVSLQVGQMINQAFTKVAVDGIQRLTKTLISGKSAFHDFGGFILKTMGELATQIGTFLISAGIGMLALKNLSAAQAIAAGVALVALGTILSSAISDGGGGVGATGGGGAGGGGGGFTPDVGGDIGLNEIEERRANTSLVVNIQGNVLDRRQTGLEIAEVIQETFGSNGLVFNT